MIAGQETKISTQYHQLHAGGDIAAIAGVTSMLWARATYEDSLFSWRIRRRQRARDLLDKIDL